MKFIVKFDSSAVYRTRNAKEITTAPIGAEINCSVKVSTTGYMFAVNKATEAMPCLCTTEKGSGYQLYPYFGGDETAPHEVNI